MTQPFKVGQTVSLAGTRNNTDRAEVWAITLNGEKVKISTITSRSGHSTDLFLFYKPTCTGVKPAPV
jgi:uncharacterized membrane protein